MVYKHVKEGSGLPGPLGWEKAFSEEAMTDRGETCRLGVWGWQEVVAGKDACLTRRW